MVSLHKVVGGHEAMGYQTRVERDNAEKSIFSSLLQFLCDMLTSTGVTLTPLCLTLSVMENGCIKTWST